MGTKVSNPERMEFDGKPLVNQRNESIGILDCFGPIPSPANRASNEIATSRRLGSLDQGCTKFVGVSHFTDIQWGHAGPGCVRRNDTILRDNVIPEQDYNNPQYCVTRKPIPDKSSSTTLHTRGGELKLI